MAGVEWGRITTIFTTFFNTTMNLSDQYVWVNEAIKHMEKHTSEGLSIDSQVSFAIAYQTLDNYRRAILTCLSLSMNAGEEYEAFLDGEYPLKQSLNEQDE